MAQQHTQSDENEANSPQLLFQTLITLQAQFGQIANFNIPLG